MGVDQRRFAVLLVVKIHQLFERRWREPVSGVPVDAPMFDHCLRVNPSRFPIQGIGQFSIGFALKDGRPNQLNSLLRFDVTLNGL
jgi:hypothetical protein